MIRSAWRRTARFLSSAVFATALLLILGVWSALASVVPQGAPSSAEVAQWAAAHAAIEPVVRAAGFHSAFSNPLFIALAVLLGISTALCAWNRTKVALHRAGTLREAVSTDGRSLRERPDFEIACEPATSAPKALSVASETLRRLGVRTKRRDDVLVDVSPRWTVWGSPIFHWALLGLLVALLVGNMLRSEGLMGVTVGETKADAPQSYGVLHTGPLHDWRRIHRSVRVDNFEPDYKTGGVDRGPTPTVSILDGAGKVVATQRVYPNHTLKKGSLTIYPSSYGLTAIVSEVNTSGAVVGRGLQLVDFSADTTGGTAPVGGVAVLNSSGAPAYRATLTVPLEQNGSGWLDQVPSTPAGRVVVVSRDGKTVLDQVIRVGETLPVPGAASLRLDGLTYYARLQVVDDWTIPLLYAGLVVALVGLSVATLTRQQIVIVTAVGAPGEVRLAVQMRLWRNAASSRSEIEAELTRALSGSEKESTE